MYNVGILFWTAAFGGGGSLAWKAGGGWTGVEALAKKNQLAYVLYE